MKINTVTIFLVILSLGACSIDGNDEKSSISEEDLYAASQIIGESLSDQKDGVFSSLVDAFEIPSQEGFNKIATGSLDESILNLTPNSREENYTYFYNPVTGIHATSFKRESNEGDAQRTMAADLKYIFKDAGGNYIEHPENNREAIEIVKYTGTREGSIITPDKSSSYERTDDYLIDGLAGESSITIAGKHMGIGSFQGKTKNGERFDRDYSLDLNFLDVRIDKVLFENNYNLEQGVTGALSHSVTINQQNGVPVDFSGIVEFAGDGTALLKFKGFQDIFTIKLIEGVPLGDDEFEGEITSINVPANFLTLASGKRIRINSESLISDSGEFTTLQQAKIAMGGGAKVTAEGHANRQGSSNNFVATEIIFNLVGGDEDHYSDEEDFEGSVRSVNIRKNTFMYGRGNRVRVDNETEFNEFGYYSTLEEVNEALRDKKSVTVKGKGIQDSRNRRLLLALNVDFTTENTHD